VLTGAISVANETQKNNRIKQQYSENNRNQIWKTIINYYFTAIYFQQLTDKSIPGG
jgi:hypothetical protein